ncbi:MAG: TonB-dependent receptor [Saprospiraceae bacterium]|nr:TonB-dependent receptor [Saprospiraceae bacterium]
MRYFIFIISLAALSNLPAQTLTVLDRDTDEPLVLVTISSDSPSAFITTDEHGQAEIGAFKSADKMEIRYIGYKTEITDYATLEANNFMLKMFRSGFSVDDIVVTATRIRQDSRDLPYAVTTLDRDQIAFQNPQTAADLLGASGEVFIQKSQQGGGSPMIRGFATNRLLYTVDGVRMNTAIFRGGNIQNVISLDPFAIENTDVYFGPSSVIYGSDAIGGVMTFQTLTPRFSSTESTEFGGEVLGRYATANQEKSGHLHLNIGGNKWASLTSISGNDYGDLRMGKNGPDDYLRPVYVERINGEDVIIQNEDPLVQTPSGYQQLNLMQKIRFSPNERWEFDFGFHLSTTTDYSRYDRHLRTRNGDPRYGEWSYGPQKWLMNLLEMDHTTGSALFDELTIRLAQQHFEESRRDRNINSIERAVRIEAVEAWSANVDFLKRFNAQSKLYYGLEGVINQVKSTGIDQNIETGTETSGPSRYPQANWSSLGAYVTYQQLIAEGLNWQTGLRYSQFKIDADFDTTFYPFPFSKAKLNKGSVTGSMGLVYRPDPSLSLSGNFATGFRAPNVDDIGKVFDSEPGAVTVPNPDLEAEYAYNLELGITKVFSEVVKIDLSAYYTLLENALVRRNYTLNGLDSIVYDGELSQVQAIQNAAEAKVLGLQAGVEIRLGRGLVLNSQLNIQKGDEELDDGTSSPSRHAAPTFGVTRLTYQQHKLQVQFYAIYSRGVDFADLPQEEQGKTEIYAADSDGNPYAPGWYTINLKGLYALSPAISLNVGMENITSQRYRPYSSGIAAAGRNLVLSLRVKV